MDFFVCDLPSKGYNCKIPKININPMTYKDIIEYNKDFANTYIQKLNKDIKLLQKDLGSTLDQLSFYDLDALIFIKKSFSVAKSSELNVKYDCPNCGKSSTIVINTEQLRYIELNDLVTRIRRVVIGSYADSYKIVFPTIGRVKEVLNIFMKYKEDIDPNIFLLCCCFDEFLRIPNVIKDAIEKSVRDDIIILDRIARLFSGHYKECEINCPECQRRSVISISELMTDIFQLLRLNLKPDEDKIILSEEL